MPKKTSAGFSTRAIHVGNEADPSTGAVAPPIFATSTYAQEELGKTKGYDYSRAGNPTRTRLEENLASLEGGSRGARVLQRHGGDWGDLPDDEVGRAHRRLEQSLWRRAAAVQPDPDELRA